MSETELGRRLLAVERLLQEMPDGLVEARRYITEHICREPEPRLLQCMVRIAADDATAGPRREIPRKLLALRTLADDQFATLDSDGSDTSAGILSAAGVLARLEQDLDRIEQDLTALPDDDQAFLRSLHEQLTPSRENLLRSRLLARFFRQPEPPALPRDGGPSARNGAILLHLIGQDLAAWLEAKSRGESPGDLWLHLENDHAMYKSISEELAACKDKTFIEGPREDFETLNQLQRSLFAAYSRLSQVLHAGQEAPLGKGAEPADPGLSASITEAEQAAAALNEANRRRREVVDDALRGVRQARTVSSRPANRAERDERNRRRRIAGLGIAAGALAVAAVVVNLMLLPPSAPAVDMSLDPFTGAMPLQRATGAGEVMLAEISRGQWDVWNLQERQEHVSELVRRADEKGFGSVWLTDEAGGQLAFWEQGSELQLF